MAIEKLAKEGYGQLELNFAAFRRNGAIEATCKIDGVDYIENGMILAVDRKARTVGLPAESETRPLALNYTTEHMYDERAKALKDFKLDAGTFLPRLGYIGKADKFTTNTVCYDTDEFATWTAVEAAFKAGRVYGKASTTGYIQLTGTATGAIVEAIEITTMPDGQTAVKFAGL